MEPLAEVVRRYFSACSEGDVEEISRHFSPDAVVYDTNHLPVHGAEAIGRFWADVRQRWGGARWHVDTVVEAGGAAAIEWTMTGRRHGRPVTVRGSEHYEFDEGRIATIRQYWTFDADDPDTSLVGYPYGTDPRFAPPAS